MENKEKKYVYFNEHEFEFKEIKEEYTKTPEDFKKYFGSYVSDEFFDENDEIVIYELVPVKTFKKEINYKFI